MKQAKSGGSVGTTDQGNGKGRSGVRPMGTAAYGGKGQGKGKGRAEGQLGQGGRGRSQGEKKPMGTAAYGGKGSKGRAVNGDRPVGAASCRRDHHTMASCHPPPPPPHTHPRHTAARTVQGPYFESVGSHGSGSDFVGTRVLVLSPNDDPNPSQIPQKGLRTSQFFTNVQVAKTPSSGL